MIETSKWMFYLTHLSMQADHPQGEIDNVRVAVRCRPLSEQEESQGCKVAVNVDQSRGDITGKIPTAICFPNK